jgi:hypothetical protein
VLRCTIKSVKQVNHCFGQRTQNINFGRPLTAKSISPTLRTILLNASISGTCRILGVCIAVRFIRKLARQCFPLKAPTAVSTFSTSIHSSKLPRNTVCPISTLSGNFDDESNTGSRTAEQELAIYTRILFHRGLE